MNVFFCYPRVTLTTHLLKLAKRRGSLCIDVHHCELFYAGSRSREQGPIRVSLAGLSQKGDLDTKAVQPFQAGRRHEIRRRRHLSLPNVLDPTTRSAISAREELTPDAETLVALSRTLNELVHNSTLGITSVPEAASAVEHSVAVNDVVITTAEHGLPEAATTTDRYVDGEHRTISNEHSGTFILTATPRPYADQPMRTVVVEGTAFLLMEQDADQIAQVAKMGGWKTVPSQPLAGPVYPFAPSSPRDHEDRGQITDRDTKEQKRVAPETLAQPHRNRLVVSRVKRSLPSFEEGIEKKEDSEDDDDEWLFNVNPTTEKADENSTEDGEDVSGNATEFKWVTIEQTEEDHPVLLISSQEAIEGLRLRVPEDALQRFEKVRFRWLFRYRGFTSAATTVIL
ncbi:unnamed protein product [Heligmosomoides polygyrus]|uniref:Uncharacterized protein n=1 Tax=Heligmosomoides polygyrus TaxID=6339 RepID=A0A183F4E7_HELPZ|nr:unnamed protein product [Heligmosomoides polygyrus]